MRKDTLSHDWIVLQFTNYMKNWSRPDILAVQNFLREVQEFSELQARVRFQRKYDPDQPRVPEGSPDGGQWTSGDGGNAFTDQAPTVWLAGHEGMPKDHMRQNKQFQDACNIAGLNKDQRSELHLEISGQNLGFHEILEIARELKSRSCK